jgi:hypothetical protein
MMKSGRPAMTAFLIWFAHFVLCWAAVEIWPTEARANHLAWVFTALALLAMAVHGVRIERTLGRTTGRDELAAFNRRFAHGAIAIATVAVLFTALPSLMLLP